MTTPTMPVERQIALPQLTLAACCWGDAAAPPLLAVHGWLDNAASFARLAPLLADRWHVIALDLPGHGHSEHLPAGSDYSFLNHVQTVVTAIDALALERVSLLGHSLGACVCSLVAAARPERIERLFLIEGLGPLGDDGEQTLARFREAMQSAPPRTRSPRAIPSIEMAVKARVQATGLAAELARPIIERNLAAAPDGWHWRSDHRLRQPSPLRLAETQIRALLAGIEAPTRLLLSEPATPYLPASLMNQRAACVPSIRVDRLGGGHHLHLEHPDAVAAWLDASP